MTDELPIYDLLGEETLAAIVAAFYRRVPGDDVLGPMYPEHDLEGAEHRLRTFLVYRFGGPQIYLKERGHPRLRMRHVPFAIGRKERDAWVTHMTAAVESAEDLDPAIATRLLDYFTMAADHLINADT